MSEGMLLAYVLLFCIGAVVMTWFWVDVIAERWTGSRSFSGDWGLTVLFFHVLYFSVSGVVSHAGYDVMWWVYLSCGGTLLTLFFCRNGMWR